MQVECRPLFPSLHCSCDTTSLQYFSECTVFDQVPIQDGYGSDCCVESASAEPVVCHCKVVSTIEAASLEGQILSGKKLLINGYHRVKLVRNFFGKLSIIQRKIPFSTHIVIPEEFCPQQPILLNYFVEDISTEPMDKSTLLISVSTLFLVCDEHVCSCTPKGGR